MGSIRKSHFVVLPQDDGSVSVYPMKDWLRRHPEQVPSGLNATTSTSQQLRAKLARQGWTLHESDREFRLVPPGELQKGNPSLRELLEVPDDDSEPMENNEGTDHKFSMESQLEEFLSTNLQHVPINGQRLSVYVDPMGRDGVQYPTAVGPIDILAVDNAGNFYVLELKRGRTPDHTLGQLARYMGWVSVTIGKGVAVFGVIVAKEISPALRYAACVVPTVSLFEYEVSFRLDAVSSITTSASQVQAQD